MEKARSVANDAGERAQQAGSSAVQFVRDHPVSSALISVGIAWMLLENSGRRSKSGAPATEPGPDMLSAAGDHALGGRVSASVAGAPGGGAEAKPGSAGREASERMPVRSMASKASLRGSSIRARAKSPPSQVSISGPWWR